MPDTLARSSQSGRLGLTDAIEALSEGFALFDDAGQLVLCNARLRQMNPNLLDVLAPGVAWELLIREARQRGLLDEETARHLRWLESRLEPGSRSETVEVEAPNGSIGAVTLSATRSGGFVLTQRDVTARRRLEANEREADEILRKVLEACPANVVMSRVGDGQVLYRSPAATELLGTAMNLADHFASREERADFVTALLPNGRVDDLDVTCLHPDGTQFPASISARLIDYRGEEVAVSAIVDLTREVELQAELAAQRETIYQNEKMSALGELLAGVAHELNNPLSVVVGHALMLREETSDPETLRRIDKIAQAAERCTRIVKSFLAMARQEPAVLSPVDPNALIRLGLDAARAGDGLRADVRVRLQDGLPPVMADADQIAQVVLNLVCNADQAIATSGVGGRVEVSSSLSGGSVEIRVADDGPGIPAGIRGRVFEPFFTTKDVGEGTGLGLALCHRVVISHRGRIRVDSRPGGGSVFTVRLPAADAPTAPSGASPDTVADRASARILIVEDEADVADLMRDILRRQGHEIEHAASGEAALKLIRERSYDLVLSDLAMPGLGGRGLYRALLDEAPALAARTAFVTGDTAGPAARAFLTETGRPRLEKPIAPAELRGLVARLLSERPA